MAIENKRRTRQELADYFSQQGVGVYDLEDMIRVIEEINALKKEKNAVILAHYYMRDGIKVGIADYIGDSLDLSKAAKATDAAMIVFCGVHFMAETAKILNPSKKVLLPSLEAGCSLAASITGADVRRLREQYPDAAVVTYINTTAEVKAESDVCVTSANAKKVISRLPQKKIVFIPDKYMARNLREELPDKEIIEWDGACIVHEQYAGLYIPVLRSQHPGLKVLAHYECDGSVIKAADMHGGTSDMRRYIRETNAPAYFLATECGLASTIKAEMPEKNIVGACTVCPYMKKIDLHNTLQTLQEEKPEIVVPEPIRARAEKCLERMFELGSDAKNEVKAA
ncbi:quinolinate synthase NadA [Candidatus Woesearchaeota archaeon]|nr:quinolinate synthase NadA [Candidatus Woesearchaeota archaeon]